MNLPAPNIGTGFQYRRNDGYIELYNGAGQLLSVTNSQGLSQTYQYSAGSQLVSITDPFGRQLAFTYDGNGRISTVSTPAGIYDYAYDTNGNLIQVTNPDSTRVQYKYENASFPNALTGLIDEDGNRYATWTYNSQGQAITSVNAANVDPVSISYTADPSTGNVTQTVITEATGLVRTLTYTNINGQDLVTTESAPCVACSDKTKSFTYDANGFVASKSDFNGNVTQYTHDAFGNEISRTEGYGSPDARTVTTQWDDNLNQPLLITEPGRTTAHGYDSVGHVLSKTVTDTATNVARTTTYTYVSSGAATGLLASVTDPLNHVTRYGYDTQGNLNSITNALYQVTQITSYDANGLPLTIVDPNGVTTTLSYDARLRLKTRTVAGAETQYSYDAVGNLVQVTLPTGSFLKYSYDTAHRLIGITDSVGDSITYTLDKLGNRTAEKTFDPSSILTKTLNRTYNSLNQLLTVVGGAGQTTTYTDDSLGNTTSIKDPMAAVTGQTFDALNRLQTVVDPESGNTTYNYDALDRVQDVTDPKGLNTHYTYDAFGDVLSQQSSDTGATTYTYDLDGNRLTKIDARGIQVTYNYDALNRLTTITYPDASRNVSYTYDQGNYGVGHLYSMTDATGSTSYSYDAHGNTVQKVVIFTGLPSHPFTTGYQYDTADNLIGMTYPSGMQVSYVRDTADRVTSITANGTDVASNITYEPFGPISGLTLGNGLTEGRRYDLAYRLTSITTTGIQGLTLGYNADDDITSIADGLNSGDSQTLGYDVLNRLTLASGSYGSQNYGYDPDGNRLNLNGTDYSYDNASNHLLTAGASAYQYDANGNLVSDGSHTYRYDASNRLTGFDSIGTAYLYNGLGQRSVKFPVIPDTAPPVVAITSPANGAIVSGTVSVTANATDDIAVASVQFQVDGTNLGAAVTTAPYDVSWNTATAAPGAHHLTAIATDTAGKSTTSATVTVTLADMAATANGGTLATAVDTAASATLGATLAYAGQTLSFAIVTNPVHGTVTLTNAATGSFTYTPAAGYVGSDSFTFDVTDGAGTASNTATESVTVVDTAATANDGSVSTPAGTPVSGTLSASSTYTGQTLSFAIATNPAHGTVTLSPSTGGFTYTPTAGYIGSDSFTFTVTDSSGTVSNMATESLTVIDVTPTANSGSVSTPVGMPVTGTLSATPAYPSQTFSFGVTVNPVHGTVILSNASTGAFTYIPAPGYVGDDSFIFTATDGAGHVSNAAPESITVTDVAATANDGSLATTAGTAASGNLSVTVAYAGQTLTYAVTNPAHGTVAVTNATTGAFTYTPATAYVGADSFTFTATDSYGTVSGIATVRITVTDVAATATNGSLSTPVQQAVNGTLAATTAYTGQTLTYAVTSPAHGTVTLSSAATGAFTYTPALGYVGPDSFTFTATDSYGTVSNLATESVTVTDVAATATNGSLSTTADQPANGSLSAIRAYASQTLSFTVTGGPGHGIVTVTNAATGAFTYTPSVGYVGSDSFTFTATDTYRTISNIATVNITVTDVAATASNSAVNTTPDVTVSGTLAATAAYIGQTLSYVIVANPSHGSVTVTNAATGAFTYTPASGYAGSDSYMFAVTDSYGTVSNTATVSVTITDVAATANNGDLNTTPDVTVNGTLAATEAYAGQTRTFSVVANPTHGSVTLTNASTGAFTYTPATGYAGNDSFTFQATDAYGKVSNIATEGVAISDVGPIANNGSFIALKNNPNSGSVSATPVYNGQILTFSITSQPVHGIVTLTDPSTGAFSYRPINGYQGPDSFTFIVTDQWGTVSGIATKSIDVLNRGHYQK